MAPFPNPSSDGYGDSPPHTSPPWRHQYLNLGVDSRPLHFTPPLLVTDRGGSRPARKRSPIPVGY